MNARKELYEAVSERLTTLNLFKWIDLYKGQLNSNEDNPTGFPCAFVSVGTVAYQNMTVGNREGTNTIEVFLFFEKGGDTFYSAVDKANTLAILDNLSLVSDHLEHLEGDCFTALELTQETDLTERYQRPAYKLSFSTLIYNHNKNHGYVSN